MAKKKDHLLEEVMQAVNKLHSDTSVPLRRTVYRLEDVRDHIETLIQGCKEDMKTEGSK
jgi:hypothetical protein